MTDKNDCSVYAVAFTCSVDPDRARFALSHAGREHADGATDLQIARAVRFLCHNMRRVTTTALTVRTFARTHIWGSFIITTSDHVVAVVDGNVCDRSWKEDVSDLMRIEKVHQITRK